MNANLQLNSDAPISHAHLGAIVQQNQEQGFTGMIKMAYLLGEELTLLIQNGTIVGILFRNKNVRKFLPGEEFQGLFEPLRTGHVTVQPTPGKCLLLERACFDSQIRETHKSMPVANLESFFAPLKAHASASVVVLRCESAWAYVLIPGSNLSMRRVIFFRDGQFTLDEAAFTAMSDLAEPYCDVTLYQGSLESDAWIRLHLNILFEYFCTHMINQYGYLTGRVMINSIARSLLFAAQDLGYDLTGSGSQLQMQTMFRTAAEAAAAYKELLGFMEKQMATMIGASFTNVMKKQGQSYLNSFYTNLVQFYSL